MSQDLFWLYSVILSSLAFVVSLLSAFYTYFEGKKSEAQKLIAKKTDILITISELIDNISELMFVTVEKVLLFQKYKSLRNNNFEQHIRLRGNLELLKEQREMLNGMRERLKNIKPTDYESWERMKATYQSRVNNIRSNISKEQKELYVLKEAVGEDIHY